MEDKVIFLPKEIKEYFEEKLLGKPIIVPYEENGKIKFKKEYKYERLD